MEHLAAFLSPLAPCLCGWMTCFDSRVVWDADDVGFGDTHDLVALSIDDVPRKGTTVQDVHAIMALLKEYDARVTFFAFFDQLNVPDTDPKAPMVREFIRAVKENGHELGIHFPGRWGNQMSLTELEFKVQQSRGLGLKRFFMDIKFLRMPGGFSTPAQVTLIEKYGLTVVNGTAYPGDADVCQCLSALALGRCAARLANSDGRIAILHDDRRLLAKVHAFLEQLSAQGKRAVTLRELLERPPELTPHLVDIPNAVDNSSVPMFFMPL